MRRVGEARRGSGAEEEGEWRQAVGQAENRRIRGGKLQLVSCGSGVEDEGEKRQAEDQE